MPNKLQIVDDHDLKAFREAIYNQPNKGFYRCFWPKEWCKQKSIRAHSIQNNRVLALLSESGHIVMLKCQQDLDNEPKVDFKMVGRNQATTFTGLCGKHDKELFKLIDDEELDFANKEQLFLLAYRSVLRELHSKMKAAVDIQSIYTKAIELGRSDPNIPDEAMQEATIAIYESYMFYRYKFSFDMIFQRQSFDDLVHEMLCIDTIYPSIAASSVFSPLDNIKQYVNRNDPKCVVLNVIPSKSTTTVVFSYKASHRDYVRHSIYDILSASSYLRSYLLSKLILMHCENFVISPRCYREMGDDKKEAIKKYFMTNIFAEKTDYNDERLLLFRTF